MKGVAESSDTRVPFELRSVKSEFPVGIGWLSWMSYGTREEMKRAALFVLRSTQASRSSIMSFFRMEDTAYAD
jgi:hypothetical protein